MGFREGKIDLSLFFKLYTMAAVAKSLDFQC